MIRRTFASYMLLLLVGCVRVPEGIDPVTNFDSEAYLGTWYEIARLENRFEAGMKACIDAGATEVDVLPYFLSAGRHVTNDVPAELAAVTKDHPGLTIKILPYVGSSDMMLDLMAEICSVRRDA